METFHGVGVADEIYVQSPFETRVARVAGYPSLSGSTSQHALKIGHVQASGDGTDLDNYRLASPRPSANVPQILLDRILWEHATVPGPEGSAGTANWSRSSRHQVSGHGARDRPERPGRRHAGRVAHVSGTASHGCLLMRPDRHVAWRAATEPTDGAAELTRVVRLLLAGGGHRPRPDDDPLTGITEAGEALWYRPP